MADIETRRSDIETRRSLDKQKFESKKNTLRSSEQAESKKQSKGELGPIGGVMFALLAIFSLAADILTIVAGGLSFFLDLLIVAGLFMMGYFTMLVVTGDPIEAAFSKRGAFNFIKTITEYFPITAFLTLHIFFVIILWLDFKYQLIDKVFGALKFKENVKQ